MKKGKWNYSEDIEYTVILVKLLPVPTTPMHWQNAFAGQDRQVVRITSAGGQQFWIDNEDGTGLLKIGKGGGPDSYHASVAGFEFVRELLEREWNEYDKDKHIALKRETEAWQQKNFPEEYKETQGLRDTLKIIQSGNWHVDQNGTIQPGKRK